MSTIKVTKPSWQAFELDKPLLTATYFGFTAIEPPKVTERDIQNTKDCEELGLKEKGRSWFDASEKSALIRTYTEKGFSSMPHPLAFAYKRHPASSSREYSLHLIGSQPGLSEALLIRTALSMLIEEGYKDLVIDINCIGDKESISAYERELHNFLKKFGGSLGPEIKKEAKRDVFSILKK
jgi:hypothetical protein